MAEDILRKIDTDWLLSIYGAMLTDKQRTIANLYYDEDLSLAEIAQQENVSRQCVHETLQRVEKQLRTLEDKLMLRQRLSGVQACLEDALQALDDMIKTDAIAGAKQNIEKALSLLTDEEEANGL